MVFSSERLAAMISRQIALMCSLAERPLAHLLQARDHLQLALRAEHRRVEMLLDLADLERHRGALVQERDQLRIDRVDTLAQRFESGVEFVVHA